MSIPFEELDPKQKQIVRRATSPLLVLAGPGTGKTEVLTHRIAYLNAQMGVPPNRILAVTFSRKAASEMLDRLRKFPGLETTEFHVLTLHAESLKLLNEIGKRRKFLVADDEARLLIKDAAEDLNLGLDWRNLSSLEKKVKLAKANNLLPGDIRDQPLQRFYRRYEELLDFNNAIDLDGLVVKVTRALLSESPSDVFEGHLLVDEYQDINQAEYKLIHILAREAESLFVVGDDDQSIYGWRGADPSIIRNFEGAFQNGRIEILEQSHRCPGHILAGAYAIVSRDPDCIKKTVRSSKGDGNPINVLLSKSWSVEAIWIANWIKECVSKGSVKPSDIAVLTKTPSLAELLVDQLRIAEIDTVYWKSGGFFSDRNILDILAYIRLVVDKDDNLALRRCLMTTTSGIGNVADTRLRLLAERNECSLWEVVVDYMKFVELRRWRGSLGKFVARFTQMEERFSELRVYQIVQSIAKEIGTDRSANIKKLQDFAKALPEDFELEDFLAEINKNRGVDLTGGSPEPETNADAVAIMSMHSSKGLGYKIIFILGMDEELLPDMNQNECEQRRLCYVAMTRAKDELFLCHAKMRKGPAAKGLSFYKPSRFISNIPKSHMKIINNEYFRQGSAGAT
ncbi:MAG: ATP-dependent helicase [Candidatus Bathyarchaeia archaeon]